MSNVAVKKDLGAQKELPVFTEIANRMEEVRKRAFELFEQRGREFGHDLDDWLAAEREVLGWPAAELKEKDSAYEMEVTLPGFTPKDVEVTATPNEVIVHACAEERKSGQNESVVWTEFGANDVYRRFAFPEGISADKITADFDNGLLRVMAPKSAFANEVSRKIPVAAG
jgi:HSP20 family protein